MDVDEDYDDSGEDDKKAVVLTNGSVPPAASGDLKAPPSSTSNANAASGPAPKTE
jgi:hypothetical protein